ncbi:hypothetical protein WJX72_004794 [[Myrmecia] bisecta]|uniref:ubiquitinyl hydrolase 1 n=1 Tax=[Myrmecia] bisecta TaxID=41462 RepID=A0AAW1QQB1_9CHLO
MADVGMAEADDLANNEPIMEALPQTDGEAEPMEGVTAITELVSPPTDPEPDPSLGEYNWEILNFSQLPGDKAFSPTFQIGGFPWRLLVFPRGNKLNYVSMYLDCSDELQPPGWSRRAAFKLTLINQLDPSKSVTKEAQHVFRESANDWGFTQFLPLQDLHDCARGFLVNDTMKLRVEVNVDRTDSIHYDSKKETGYVGLKNQGATCYMNSLLQTLYNINFFRQAVYHMPTTEDDEPAKSMPLALQSLFYKLQFGDTSVSTKDLTKSFGWDTQEAFMQHDVQELNRVLCEKLEEKMKATKVEGTINKLFEGHTHNFIECTDVDFKSTRRESFMDLQLDVKGSKDIYDSFDKYCEIEMLDGQNQYKAEGHGLQDARKGVLFDVLPPVLQLQLKRFEYDFQRDIMVKINDRYEFFDELDLDREDGKYLAPTADRSVRNKYRLHSVLVHSGGVHGGHYYAYIRPDGKQWLKFDDEKVTKEDKRKALDEQFGGEDENPAPAPGFNNPPTFKFTKYSNAYMLVYVRESDWGQVMCSVTEKDISDHVRLRLQAEADEKERRRKEKLEAHLFTIIKVARDEDMLEQIGSTRFFDLVDHDKVKQFRVRKQLLFSDFKAEVERQLGVPVDRQRYWLWAKRQNNTFRPNRVMQLEDDAKQVMEIKDGTYRNGVTDLRLYLEVPHAAQSPTSPLLPISKNEILLFFKFYDPLTETLRYAGRGFAHKTTKVADMFPMLRKMAGLPEDAPLEAYEEIKFEPNVMCDQLQPKTTLTTAQLEDGDIMCYQLALAPEDAAKLRHPRVKDFLEYVRNRQVVVFKKLDTPADEGIKLELSKVMTYDDVCRELAAALKLPDPQLLRLTQHNCYSQTPKPAPLKFRGLDSLVDMLVHYNQVTDILYYEVLDLPLPELERLKTLKVVFHNEKTEEVATHTVRLPKESVVGDVLAALALQLGPAVAARPLRLLEVFYCKIYKVFDPKEKIDTINDQYWTVRAEVVPEDELQLKVTERMIMVYHMQTDAHRNVSNFGDPFLLRIDEAETLADVRPRIQAKLGVSDEEIAKWKFAHVCTMRPPEYLADEDVLAQRWPQSSGHYPSGNDCPYLGLEHADAHPRRNYHQHNRLSQYERPVKIYN